MQLANPRLTNMDREAITAVLQFTNTQQQQQQHQQQLEMLSSTVIASQLQNLHNLAIVQQTFAARQQQQQQQPQSQPTQLTQEDLRAHANNIMRNAVIKRKMEEQTSKLLNIGVATGKQQQSMQQQQARSQLPQMIGTRTNTSRQEQASNALLNALMSGKTYQQVASQPRRSDSNLSRFSENGNYQMPESSQPTVPYHVYSQQQQQQQLNRQLSSSSINNNNNNNFNKTHLQSQKSMAMLSSGSGGGKF